MPTYDYQCSGCGQAFEVFQRMSDEPVSSCPDCGARARRRITGGAGFIFKGEGFYITDHRSQEYRDRAAADAGKEKPASAPNAGAASGAEGSDSGAKKESTPSTPDASTTSPGADSARSSSRSDPVKSSAGAGSATSSPGDGSPR